MKPRMNATKLYTGQIEPTKVYPRKTPEEFARDYGGPAGKIAPFDNSHEAMLKRAKEWQDFADEQLKALRENLF